MERRHNSEDNFLDELAKEIPNSGLGDRNRGMMHTEDCIHASGAMRNPNDGAPPVPLRWLPPEAITRGESCLYASEEVWYVVGPARSVVSPCGCLLLCHLGTNFLGHLASFFGKWRL